MYIKTRVVTVVFRLSIGALSAFASWLLFHIFGNEAWRLSPTWIMLTAAIYYFCLAFFPAFSKRRDSGRVICPTMQGAIIVSGMTLAVFRMVFDMVGIQVIGLEGTGMVLVNFILPTLFVLDWILFTKKGRWRAVDPFYWLALLICYNAWILLSAEFMNASAAVRYPYGFLDFNTIGIDLMLAWFAVIAIVVLSLGYVCVGLDFAMSGNLAKYVVLPHIKTIIIEEEVDTSASEAVGTHAKVKDVEERKNSSKTLTKPAKSEPKSQPATSTASVISKKPQGKTGAGSSQARTKAGLPSKSKTKTKKQPIALLEAETKTSRTVKSKATKTGKSGKISGELSKEPVSKTPQK